MSKTCELSLTLTETGISVTLTGDPDAVVEFLTDEALAQINDALAQKVLEEFGQAGLEALL